MKLIKQSLNSVLNWVGACRRMATQRPAAWLALFVVAFAGVAPLGVTPARAIYEVPGQFAQLPGRVDDAEFKTGNLFNRLRGWAGWVLIVSFIIAALFAIAGNYKYAIGIAIAAVLLYGGIYLLALVRSSIVDG